MFTDDQYTDACKALIAAPDTPGVVPDSLTHQCQLDGWEFFVESNDVTIYRLYNSTSGLYEYKIFGFMRDVTPDICAKVYMDAEYRRTWDSYVNTLDVRETLGREIIYWCINYPFFMSNRDYVYTRELREMDYEGRKISVVLAKSVTSPEFPEKPGIIRVSDYFQSAAMMSDGKVGTKAYMHYYDNPGGMIPTMLINWAAKTGVPQFLTIMQKACRGYLSYQQQERENKS